MIILLLLLPLFAAELFRFGPDNHMLFVEAKINDNTQNYLFKIDPSMRYSVITDIVAKRMKLPKTTLQGNEICQDFS